MVFLCKVFDTLAFLRLVAAFGGGRELLASIISGFLRGIGSLRTALLHMTVLEAIKGLQTYFLVPFIV